MTEVRLIDANALKREFSITPYNDYDDLIRTEKLIDNAPTVEPERLQGEWIIIGRVLKNGNPLAVRCSICNNSPKYAVQSNFCPNCGVKMANSAR